MDAVNVLRAPSGGTTATSFELSADRAASTRRSFSRRSLASASSAALKDISTCE